MVLKIHNTLSGTKEIFEPVPEVLVPARTRAGFASELPSGQRKHVRTAAKIALILVPVGSNDGGVPRDGD